MTTFTPEEGAPPRSGLAAFLPLLPCEGLEAVHASLLGHELILEGHVPSYAAKRKIEAAVRAAGYRSQNWLRVIPGDAVPQTSNNPLVAPPGVSGRLN